MAKVKYKYESHIIVNDRDSHLKSIRIEMPPPPKNIEDVVGWNLPIEEQKFQKEIYPQRLFDLENRVRKILKDEHKGNSLKKITTQKFLTLIYETIRDKQKDYQEELAWIRQQWEYREKGRWYFINGEARFIPGSMWFFMNYWRLDGTVIPEYRNGDRLFFLVAEFANTTTLDNEGQDKGYRTLLGVIQPKNRRYGASNKGLCFGYWLVTDKFGRSGGIQSFDETSARKQFSQKLVPAWRKMAWFFKPMFSGSENPAKSLDFVLPSNQMEGEALESKFDYATTASRKFYDGHKLYYLMMDEQGKTLLEDVHERHAVVKESVSLGADYIGFIYSPSTVGELVAQGGEAFFTLCEQSRFYDRDELTGQTISGLMVYFAPAYENLENFIDEYGEPIIDDPTPRQIKYTGRKQGAKQFLQSKLDTLLKKGDAKSMTTYYKQLELYPMEYMDCFRITGGGINFNQDNLDYAVLQCREKEETIKGNLEWLDGKPNTRVIFKEHPEGRWEFTEIPIEETTNLKTKGIFGWQPSNLMNGMLGSDGIRFLKTSDVKKFDIPDKLSDGAMVGVKRRDPILDTDDKPIESWKTPDVTVTYLYRHFDSEDFNKDVLLTAIYLGYMINPETNLESTFEYILKQGYGGYLNYAVDTVTGKRANKPGTYSGEGTKQKMFSLTKTYIEYHGKKIKHIKLLKQLKGITSIEEMTKYDLVAAFNMAMMGLDSPYAEIRSGYERNKEDDETHQQFFEEYDYS